jgi:hypothetical protein
MVYKVQAYKGLSTTEPKTERGIGFTFLQSTRHSNDRNRRNGIKKAINTQQAKGSIHLLLYRRGLRTREEEEWNPYPFDQLAMERAKVGI